ncbi:TetR/AcrR family transcriptional regulator [Serratia microhaemolytica]|uniref:TetR/AcrR family transcriptional regulator n=1 Tax=Serratia microhaemolytica TaxID=2675110 RepID=UPI000FDEA3AB|nr:TetR/AcrR family transcriptional regulator [Serratia microhaemolytica]
MILFDENNLSPVRRRTLERLTHAALRLYQEKKFPSPEEVTREAEYAKVTLKSYFSTYGEFVEYMVKHLISNFDSPPVGNSAEDNLETLLTWGFEQLDLHEALMRDAMRIAQQRWQDYMVSDSEMQSKGLVQTNYRKNVLSDALSPLNNQLPKEVIQRLVMLLSVLYGTEALTVLKDGFGLTKEEIIELTVWGAKLMLRQALQENNP